MAKPSVRAEITRGGTLQNVLRAGAPVLGATSPTGRPFVGWVLVQIWENSPRDDGVQVQFSGDQGVLLRRAASSLNKVVRNLGKPPAATAS